MAKKKKREPTHLAYEELTVRAVAMQVGGASVYQIAKDLKIPVLEVEKRLTERSLAWRSQRQSLAFFQAEAIHARLDLAIVRPVKTLQAADSSKEEIATAVDHLMRVEDLRVRVQNSTAVVHKIERELSLIGSEAAKQSAASVSFARVGRERTDHVEPAAVGGEDG